MHVSLSPRRPPLDRPHPPGDDPGRLILAFTVLSAPMNLNWGRIEPGLIMQTVRVAAMRSTG